MDVRFHEVAERIINQAMTLYAALAIERFGNDGNVKMTAPISGAIMTRM